MNCLYSKKNNLPPCVSIFNKKWGYLKDFLLNKSKGDQYFSIVHNINCIQINNNQININRNHCIKCLFCLLNCPGNLISIEDDFNLKEGCSDFENIISDNNKEIVKNYFNNELVEIPYSANISKDTNYKNFEEFASVDETRNIAVWGASLIKFLSLDPESRLGLEIKMIIQSRDRGGRLDICLFSNDEFLIAAETKISFVKMMQEGRYVSQMISYKEEILKNLQEVDLSNIKSYPVLLIDGRENDLLFSNHINCTSKIGNQSDIFYKNLVEHDLFFISATALWALSLKKLLIDKEKYSIENVLSKMIDKKNYGLVSAGVITKNGSDFIVEPLDSYLN